MSSSTSALRAVRIFKPRDEFVLVAFPVALIALVIVESMAGIRFDPSSTRFLWFIADILCINGFHYIYTFRMAFMIPQYREILNDHWAYAGMGGILAVGGLCIGLKVIEPYLSGSPKVIEALFIYLIPAFHGVRQSFGISLVYNQLARRGGQLAEAQLVRLARVERFERIYPFVILGLSGTYFLAKIADVDASTLWWMSRVFAAGVFAMISHIMWLYLRLERSVFRVKLVFLVRLFLLGMTYFSPLAAIALCAIHGVEYILVCERVIRNARGSCGQTTSPVFFWVTYALLSLTIVVGTLISQNVGLPLLITSESWYDLPFVKALVIGIAGLALYHVYLDGLIFAMRKPDVRQKTGAWLLQEPSER